MSKHLIFSALETKLSDSYNPADDPFFAYPCILLALNQPILVSYAGFI